jgi:hypothetical protein
MAAAAALTLAACGNDDGDTTTDVSEEPMDEEMSEEPMDDEMDDDMSEGDASELRDPSHVTGGRAPGVLARRDARTAVAVVPGSSTPASRTPACWSHPATPDARGRP